MWNDGELISKVEAGPANDTVTSVDISLVLVTPTYGPVDPRHAKYLRVAIMSAARKGVKWVGDVSCDRMLIDASRNASAKAAIDSGADGVIWVDSDIIMPSNGIYRLVSYGRDFTSGVYFQREGKNFPLIATYDKAIDSFRWMTRWPKDVVFPADGVGFGFCFTSTRLLKKMYDDIPEVKKRGWFYFDKFSEDFTFSRHASSVGCPPYVDTGILLGHLGQASEVTVETFKANNPYQEGTAEPLMEQVNG